MNRTKQIEKAKRLRSSGKTYREIAEQLEISITTAYVWVNGPRHQSECEICGAPTSAEICRACFCWTPEQQLQAIDDWAKERGVAPRVRDFREMPGWPSPSTLARSFGSFNNALQKAGFIPRAGGSPRLPSFETIALEIKRGRKVSEIAKRYAVTTNGVYNCLYRNGTNMQALREGKL